MKARIIITDNGTTFEGETELAKTTGSQVKAAGKLARPTEQDGPGKMDFGLPLRAFVNEHARGLSGPRKFVLLVAYLAKGQLDKEIQLRDVETRWNRMTSLLGGEFNRKYSGVARDKGWVDTRKAGVYLLRTSWRQALQAKK